MLSLQFTLPQPFPSPIFLDATHISIINVGSNNSENIIICMNLKESQQAYNKIHFTHSLLDDLASATLSACFIMLYVFMLSTAYDFICKLSHYIAPNVQGYCWICRHHRKVYICSQFSSHCHLQALTLTFS